jgi:dynein heavy chain
LVLQDGWPDIIAKEVTDNLHKFIANIYVTIGQTKGKTLLALPPTDVSRADAGTLLEGDACTPSECHFRTMCQTLPSPVCWFL